MPLLDTVFCSSVSSWHVSDVTSRVLILHVSKMSATAMYRSVELKDGLFQLSTFVGAGFDYSKLQATKAAHL